MLLGPVGHLARQRHADRLLLLGRQLERALALHDLLGVQPRLVTVVDRRDDDARAVRVEQRVPQPLVDMNMMRRRAVFTTNLTALLVGFVGYGGVGGTRAVEQLRLIAAELQMATVRTQVA